MKPLAILLAPLLAIAACTPPQQRTAQLLDNRMQDRLAPDIAAGQTVVQRLPDAVRVTLLDPSLFPNGTSALDDQYPDIRASVIEAMLDPRLMQVSVVDTSALSPDQREIRARNVEQYFTANGLGSVLRPAEPSPSGTPRDGLTITINVQCPQWNDGSGYGSGTSQPVCE